MCYDCFMVKLDTRLAAMRAALAELAGAVILLDPELRITLASAAAEELLGEPAPVGARAAQLLCGQGDTRPIADALAAGESAIATVVRPGPGGDRALRIAASPLADGAGWLLRLSEDAPGLGRASRVDFHGIITADPGMLRLLHVARRAARAGVTVLVRGETGTGKELLARALHALSPRAEGPFHAINCAALSPALLESELFGHVRGAFTGAVSDSPGYFRQASGGTLFLDEVVEMAPELQAKLLRVLETGTVIPVGATDAIPVDVRIVAATHTSLRAEVAAGRFRADLMYWLRKVPLFLPPLRERRGDVALVAEHLVGVLAARAGRPDVGIGQDAMTVLERYDWPGNVRELINAIEYALVIGDGPVIGAADLPPEIVDPDASPEAAPLPLNAPVAADHAQPEAVRIRRALERAGGHRARAARSLGWSRVTLWRHMRDLGLAAD
jgi:transcriptional regulator with PAS, ATPase and Fis domain